MIIVTNVHNLKCMVTANKKHNLSLSYLSVPHVEDILYCSTQRNIWTIAE